MVIVKVQNNRCSLLSVFDLYRHCNHYTQQINCDMTVVMVIMAANFMAVTTS